jgi:hypothetical protein
MADLRCQSCGMPLGAERFFSTNKDGGTINKEYCKFSFQNIGFTMPDITVDDMVRMSVNFL